MREYVRIVRDVKIVGIVEFVRSVLRVSMVSTEQKSFGLERSLEKGPEINAAHWK